jgi:hypothetical protein
MRALLVVSFCVLRFVLKQALSGRPGGGWELKAA